MVIQRYALVRSPDGLIVNVCVWDGTTPWDDSLPSISAIQCPENVGPGWSFIDGEWLPPQPPADPPPEE